MHYKKIKLSVLLLLGFGLTGLQAQEVIPTTGGNASGSGGSVSYTVGQTVYTTNTATNGSVSQGIQQPYEISVVSGIEIGKDISLSCSVFPNPATDIVRLKVENYLSENLSYQLYDINGSLLEDIKIEGSETSVVLNNLLPSTYFLRVIQGIMVVKVFKIIKN